MRVRARVERAREHIAALSAELAPGGHRELYRTSTESQADGSYVLGAQVAPGLLLHWGVIISDALHNLRSALDEAVCQLVRLAQSLR